MLAITAGNSENGDPNGPPSGALVPLEKKFQCTECGKAFTRMDKLRIHNRIHTGVMPYGCQYCEKRFYRWDAWKRHEVRHNQEKGEVRAMSMSLRSESKAHIRLAWLKKVYQYEIAKKVSLF